MYVTVSVFHVQIKRESLTVAGGLLQELLNS